MQVPLLHPQLPEDPEAVPVLPGIPQLLEGEDGKAGDHQHHRPVGHQGAQEEGGGGGLVHLLRAGADGVPGLALHAVLRVDLPEGGGQVPGIGVGDGLCGGEVPVGHHRHQGLADFVGEDVHQVGVVVVEGLPQGIGIGGGAGGQGEGPPVGVQGGVAGQEGGPVLLPGGGPPLGGEGAGGQGDGVVPRHRPDGVVV